MGSKIGRNDPCLCGSGKKYKKCCLNKGDFGITTSNANRTHAEIFSKILYPSKELDQEWIDHLIQYNQEDLIIKLTALAVHPLNRRYLQRFEILIEYTLSIPTILFKQEVVTGNVLQSLLGRLSQQESKYFYSMEDNVPENNLTPLPFYLNQHKYYYFFGGLERPHEYLNHFKKVFVSLDPLFKDKYGYSVSHITEILLDYSTKIIKDLKNLLGDASQYDNIPMEVFTGSEAYFRNWRDIYEKATADFRKNILLLPQTVQANLIGQSGIIKPTDFHSTGSPQSLYMFCAYDLKGQLNPILPTIAIEFLYYHFSKLLFDLFVDIHQLKNELWQGALQRVMYSLSKLRQWNLPVGVIACSEENRSPYVDIAIILENTIIPIIVINRLPEDSSFKVEYEAAKQRLVEFVDFVKKHENFFLQSEGKSTGLLKTEHLQVIPILIINNVSIMDSFSFSYLGSELCGWSGSILDFEAMCSEFKSIEDLLKYIRARYELNKKTSVFAIDDIDLLAIYLPNQSFPPIGKYPHGFATTPHSWSEYIHKKLLDTLGLEIHFHGDDDWVIEPYRYYYFAGKPDYSRAAYVARLPSRDIWIGTHNRGISYKEKYEPKIVDFVAQIIAFYFGKHTDIVDKYIFDLGISQKTTIWVSVYASSVISREESLVHHRPLLENLNKSKDAIIANPRIIAVKDTIGIPIIVQEVNILDFFKNEDASGEKHIVSKVLYSLKDYCKVNISVEPILNNMFPKGYKGGFSLRQVESPYQEHSLKKPRKIQIHDIMEINRLVAEYLYNQNIQPGIYQGTRAVGINGSLYEFLLDLLQTEIKKYEHKSLLIYALKSINDLISHRNSERVTLKADMQRDVLYNPVEKDIELDSKMLHQISATRLVIENIVKLGTDNNGKIIDIEGWDHTIAIAAVMAETIALTERIKHNILPVHLEVTQDYEFKDTEPDDKALADDYNKALAMDYLKSNKIEETSEEKGEIKSIIEEIKEMSNAFIEEFGVDLMTISYVLIVGAETPRETENIVINISVDEFIQSVKKYYPDLKDNEIRKVIHEFSLSKENLIQEKYGPWELRRRKNRLGFKPMILIGDTIYLSHYVIKDSYLLIYEYVSEGKFPVSIRSQKLRDALDERHLTLTKQFELQVFESVHKFTPHCQPRLKKVKGKNKKIHISGICGEIDTLAVFPQHKLILVIEAKDIRKGITPIEIKEEHQRLFEKIEKFKNKITFVRNHIPDILHHFNISAVPNGFEVEGLFVTKSIHLSIYLSKQKIKFAHQGNLESIIKERLNPIL